LSNEKQISTVSLDIVYLLGIIFLLFQGLEYQDSAFTISDGVYGSVFFMATGFHGFHVGVGSIMLMVMKQRLLHDQMNYRKHVGFECAA
jgi:cytochrome c oxidase subunit 3